MLIHIFAIFIRNFILCLRSDVGTAVVKQMKKNGRNLELSGKGLNLRLRTFGMP